MAGTPPEDYIWQNNTPDFYEYVSLDLYTSGIAEPYSLVCYVSALRSNSYFSDAELIALSFPSLTYIGDNVFFEGSNLESLDMPNLVACGDITFDITSTKLTSVVLPSLVQPPTIFAISNNYNGLETISLPSLQATDYWYRALFTENSLTQECVDALLAQWVSIGQDFGELWLCYGSNAAPSVQGEIDAQTLRDRGMLVYTNPDHLP
jgi:hypothetical protein